MSSEIDIISLNPANIAQYGCPCFLNPRHEGHLKKLDWSKERFPEGLKIKLLFLESGKGPVGFIEYIPGEYA